MRRMSERKIYTVGESNDGCLGGDDKEDPPLGKTEKYHAVNHRHKIRKSKKSLND